MMKKIAPWIVVVALVSAPLAAAFAQGSGAAAPPPAAGEPAPPPAADAAATPATPPASDARKACADAMNADPTFREAIVKEADRLAAVARDEATVEAHKAADRQIQKNEKHVIYAYAAMWIIAAGFVVYLWRRQQALKLEIAGLRRDLEAAAEDAGKAPS